MMDRIRDLARPTVRFVRRTARRTRGRREKMFTGSDHAVFWHGENDQRRLGMYLMGSCDLPAIFRAIPLIRAEFDGTCGIMKHGTIVNGRSDVILQTLQDFPEEPLAEARQKLRLTDDYFEPVLFERSFRVPEPEFKENEFDKNVVVLSASADAVRTVYRHKEHGFLLDPGGFWLNRKTEAMADPKRLKWLRDTFESVGRASAEQFFDNYSKLIPLLKERTGAEIVIFNLLTVEPGNPTHNYQLIKNAHTRHRREINLALFELIREFDVSLIDVDGVLKRVGIREAQVDFAHYPDSCYGPIAQEFFRVLKDRGVFEPRA